MLVIIGYWIFLFITVYLIGRLFLSVKILSFLGLNDNVEWYEYFWSGLFVVFGILQIWSIFLPVNIYSLIFIVLLALASLIKVLRTGIKLPRKINYYFFAFCLAGFLVISYNATQGVYMSDTAGYHLNAVKWTSNYPVVPGLANLHSRLGFNTSFFPFAAMLNNGFMQDRVSHLASSFFVAVLFVEFVWILSKSKSLAIKLFCILTAPAITGQVISSQMVSSLYYDLALVIFVLAACIELVNGNAKSLFVSMLLALMVFTVKLSGAFFSILVIVFVLYKFFVFKRPFFRRLFVGTAVAGLFMIVPYIARNAILSGWLLYPLPFLKINFDWTVPASRVERLNTVIQTWAKVPGLEWSKYIGSGFWDWFPLWYERTLGSLTLMFFAIALALISPFTVPVEKLKTVVKNNLFWVGVISLISFSYILFTAPDLRFGGIFIWTFFASVVAGYLSIFKWDNNTKGLIVILALIFIFKYSGNPHLDTEPLLKSIRWDQAAPTKNINGILMPEEDSCGNSDLPCTPEISNIKWRVPGDLSKGFAPAD
jgi:hypothetical protein